MARFYQPSEARFIDFELAPTAGGTTGTGATPSMFGDFNLIDEDVPRFQEVMDEYENRVSEIVGRLQQDKKADVRGEIMNLRRDLGREMTAGELRAMKQRYDEFSQLDKQLQEVFAGRPYEYEQAKRRIVIDPLEYDPSTGAYGKIKGPQIVAPWTPEREASWKTNALNLVKEKVQEEYRNRFPLSPTESYTEMVTKLGYNREDVERMLANTLSPEDVQAVNQFYDMYGIPGDETAYYQDGRPNLNTRLGRTISDLADAFAGTTQVQRQGATGSNIGEEARLRAQYNRSSGSGQTTELDEYLYDKIIDLYKGLSYDVYPAVQSGYFQPAMMTEELSALDNVFAGKKYGDLDLVVERVIMDPAFYKTDMAAGNPLVPHVLLVPPKQFGKDNALNSQASVVRPLDLDFFRNMLSKTSDDRKKFEEIYSRLKANGLIKNTKLNINQSSFGENMSGAAGLATPIPADTTQPTAPKQEATDMQTIFGK